MTPSEIMERLLATPAPSQYLPRCGGDSALAWATNSIALITWENGTWTPPKQDTVDISVIVSAPVSDSGADVDLSTLTIIPTLVECSCCDGTGLVGDCPECRGDGGCTCTCGHEHDCKQCEGSGTETGVGDPCEDCGGKGTVDSWPKVEVTPGTTIDGLYLDLFRQLPGCGPLHVDGEKVARLRWDGGVAVVMPIQRHGR